MRVKSKLKSLHREIILYLIFAVLMVIVISLKINYYVDEIYSYGLANETGLIDEIEMSIEYGETYTPGVSAYLDYVGVQKGERFDYSSVWRNQAIDVHPPLYYAVLHTICSLFAGTFSKWYAGFINIVFALLVLFVLRKLIRLLTDDKYVLAILSGTFVFMTGILRMAVYFRMYFMAMLWVTLLTYLFVRQVDKPQTIKDFYLPVYLVTVAGALTHYYVIIFAVLISCVYGVYLLWSKRGKETLFFCMTMVLAGGTSLAVFPAMIEHIFRGYRGRETIENLSGNADYWEDLKGFFDLVDRHMFGKMLGFIIIGLVVTAVIRCFGNHLSDTDGTDGKDHILFGFDRTSIIRYALIFIPCLSYFMVVSRVTPGLVERFVFPIYAVLFAGILCMSYTVLKSFFRRKAFLAVSIIMTAMLIGRSYAYSDWQYLYRDTGAFLRNIKAHAGYDCVCVFEGSPWQLYMEFAEYSEYKSITFITLEELEKRGIDQWASPDGVIISFIEVADHGERVQQLAGDNGYMQLEYLGNYGFDHTYFLGN